MTQLKKLHRVQGTLSQHWVGDGFPVRTLMAYGNGLDNLQSPFLLLDYAGPYDFPATKHRLGVGQHPHRGFETVTIVYEGEVEHRDSSGAGGKIGPGDVQWMTAASGVVHEEFHGREFAQRGGQFEVVQLWVNLPAKDKMNPPGYQALLNADIPVVTLPENQGNLRVIAGEFEGHQGPAQTHTPIQMWDMRLNNGAQAELKVTDGYSTLLVVLKGRLQINHEQTVSTAQVGIFALSGDAIQVTVTEDTTALLLSGAPLNEPVVGHGPFVMNTTQEIHQAMRDYQAGRMGYLT